MIQLIVVVAFLLFAMNAQAQLRFHATLTQQTVFAPSAAVFENTLIGKVDFDRLNPGVYRLRCMGAFPNDAKVTGKGIKVLDTIGTTIFYLRIVWDDENPGNGIIIQTYSVEMLSGTTTYVDGHLTNTEIDLNVYP